MTDSGGDPLALEHGASALSHVDSEIRAHLRKALA